MEYCIFDRRYFADGRNAHLLFSTPYLELACDVARRIGTGAVVMGIDAEKGREDLVFETRNVNIIEIRLDS